MADRPLTASNQLTLMFFLFFKKRDAIIDRLITQADEVFQNEAMSDIASDVRFVDDGVQVLKEAQINESIDLNAEATSRLEAEDRAEEKADDLTIFNSNEAYSAALTTAVKVQFATARIELLGQVIRSFSGTLDGVKKQEILEAVFRLGLRSLHATLNMLAEFARTLANHVGRIDDKKQREHITGLLNRLVALVARLICDSSLLSLSRAVGVSDIEEAYEDAIKQVRDTCATQLLELTIKLDQSEDFPFKLLSETKKRVTEESKLASLVLSDLVVRHTTIFPKQRETLRRIGATLKVDPAKLLEGTGK
jgi:hypothetical protein